MKRKKTVRICSREWKFIASEKSGGGKFTTWDKDGDGSISIGTKGQSNRYILEVVLHEIVEGILSFDDRRWKENDNNILFCFNHQYLGEFCPKLLDALVSCRMIDPEKKII